MSKTMYEVKSPLHHDGREYAIGKRVELGDDEATMLMAAGVVEMPAAAPAPVDVVVDVVVDEIADAAPAVDAQADAEPKVVDIKAGKTPGNKKK